MSGIIQPVNPLSLGGDNTHTDPLFKQFNLLKLNDIITLQTQLFVYKSLHVNKIESDFQFAHSSQTRRQDCLQLPLCRTSHYQRYLTYRGAKYWNQLPEHIKNSNSQIVLKKEIKLMLLNNY